MFKITFIEPPLNIYKRSSWPVVAVPLLWMLTLGTYLKKMMGQNVSISVLDGQILKLEQVLRELRKIKPHFVGLCPKYYSYPNALNISRLAKELGAKVVLGGPHASFLAKEILLNRGPTSNDYCVDACVYGDGEKAFYEYIIGKDLSKIKNLLFVKNGKIVANPREYLNLDELPTIDRDLINVNPYFRLSKRILPAPSRSRIFAVYSHKGCFYGNLNKQACVFCGGDKRLRLRSPENFWREVDNLVKKYDAEVVANFADGFPLVKNSSWFQDFYRSSQICKNKPYLSIRTLPSFINKETVKILKELNVIKVRLPITNYFPGCALGPLRSFKKNDLSRICRPFKLLSQAGISALTYFIPGAFRTTQKDMEKIFELSRLLSSLKGVNIIFARGNMPVPGSRGWQMLLERTGEKYKNKDLINWREVSDDWITYFGDKNLLSSIQQLEKSIEEFMPNDE